MHDADGEEMEAYERLLGDAMRGDATLFAREDSVEAAWQIVDPVLGDVVPVRNLRSQHLGPGRAPTRRIVPPGGWHDPGARFGATTEAKLAHCQNHAMHLEIFADPDEVPARRRRLSPGARATLSAIAVDSSWPSAADIRPWQMSAALANEEMPWPQVHVVQIDERVAPAGDDAAQPDASDRQPAGTRRRCRPTNIHAMPVEAADLDAGAAEYARNAGRIRRHAAGAGLGASGSRSRWAHRRRWCLAIRCSKSPTATLRRPACISDIGA